MESLKHDVVIIGAGPAGLQLGYYLKKAGIEFSILESADHAGAFFSVYPRHRKLISINKVHTGKIDSDVNMRWDWNSLLDDDDEPILFRNFTKQYFPHADVMPKYLAAFCEAHGLPVEYSTPVTKICRHEGMFEIQAGGRCYRARCVVMATGVSLEYLPQVPGIDLAEHYGTVSVDPNDFTNQRVLILGKGNSAFETADNLIETAASIHVASPNPLKMAWSTHYVGHLRAVNNNFLDTYQLKSQNAVLDAQVVSISKRGSEYVVEFSYAHAEGEVEVITYDRVITCTGFRFDASVFDESAMPAMCINDRFPEQSPCWESVNVPNLYFAGTIMQARDFKRYMSGFVHGFRYNVRTLFHILAERHFSRPYPRNTSNAEAGALTMRILDRVNSNSSLWQQPGFLHDIFVLDRNSMTATHYQDLPLDEAKIRFLEDEFFALSLEFGSTKFENPFNVSRIARDNTGHAEQSNFLHPVIRLYRNGVMVSEHHVIEDLAAEWVEPEHIQPLHQYLAASLLDNGTRAEQALQIA